ncbi:MAG: universal stress protein [Acidimicrobiaceae bacterium]|nr:universal stress protein [Acidimicrobiaceae bacterium]
MFKKVLVAADGTTTAKRAVEVAASLAAMAGGALHIVTVQSPKNVAESLLPGEFKHVHDDGGVSALLQDLSFIAKAQGLDPVLHHAGGEPADAIIETAAQIEADLVVVGNRGMKGARRVLGSVPNSVAHGVNCSIMVVDTSE